MNRTSKWYQTTRETKRPRRQCYQPLRVDEDLDDKSREVDCGIDNSIKLTSLQPDLYVEKILEPGDTLQTLSLHFNCPVAELKRINHILRDNEIYARRKIKVPVKTGSSLTEKLARVHSNNGQKQSANVSSSTDEENENTVVINSNPVVPKEFVYKSFHLDNYSKCEDILSSIPGLSTSSKSATTENTLLDVEISASSLLVDVSDEEINASSENDPLKCNGADWGISWLHLFICALLLGFSGPLFYILYITEKKN